MTPETQAQSDSASIAERRRTQVAANNNSVQEFLDEMARALTAGEAATVAAMWEVPALVIDDQAVQGIDSIAELQAFFSGAREQYNARGITDTRADIVKLDWLTERIAQVEVRWPHLDATGNEVGEETSTYTLRRDEDGDLKLRAAIMQGARAPH